MRVACVGIRPCALVRIGRRLRAQREHRAVSGTNLVQVQGIVRLEEHLLPDDTGDLHERAGARLRQHDQIAGMDIVRAAVGDVDAGRDVMLLRPPPAR